MRLPLSRTRPGEKQDLHVLNQAARVPGISGCASDSPPEGGDSSDGARQDVHLRAQHRCRLLNDSQQGSYAAN